MFTHANAQMSERSINHLSLQRLSAVIQYSFRDHVSVALTSQHVEE